MDLVQALKEAQRDIDRLEAELAAARDEIAALRAHEQAIDSTAALHGVDRGTATFARNCAEAFRASPAGKRWAERADGETE